MRWFWWQMLIVSRPLESFHLPPPSKAERTNESDMLTDLVAFIVQLYADEVSLTFLVFSSSNLLALAVSKFRRPEFSRANSQLTPRTDRRVEKRTRFRFDRIHLWFLSSSVRRKSDQRYVLLSSFSSSFPSHLLFPSGVILLALCLTLGLESMQRLYSPETMTLPPLVAGLGALALVWNVIMFRMFNEAHSHSHGHGEKELSFCHPSRFRRRMIEVSSILKSTHS